MTTGTTAGGGLDSQRDILAVPDHQFPHLEAAQFALLTDSVSTVGALGKQFVVVAGWSPVLLNSGPIRHPGTRDVDLLFESGATADDLGDVVSSFLKSGYLQSAKHPFQLLRRVLVGGVQFAFNIDLLHPLEHSDDLTVELFVDHLDLDVLASPHADLTMFARSIGTPSSQLIFTHGLYLEKVIDSVDWEGQHTSASVPLLDELGLILTKSLSLWNPKRIRDAFDIYLSVAQARDYDGLVARSRSLVRDDEEVATILTVLAAGLEKSAERFDDRVWSTIRSQGQDEALAPAPSGMVEAFLRASGVRMPAP